jgi:ribosome-associated translation inhibitor RaiA
MTSKVQITFRRSLPSELARDVVSQKFDKLSHQLPYTARCHVVLDGPSGGAHKGAAFTARVDIQGAGMPLCTEAENRDPCAAIREAFERVEAQAQKTRVPVGRSRANAQARDASAQEQKKNRPHAELH